MKKELNYLDWLWSTVNFVHQMYDDGYIDDNFELIDDGHIEDIYGFTVNDVKDMIQDVNDYIKCLYDNNLFMVTLEKK